jgi:hypothetical protein
MERAIATVREPTMAKRAAPHPPVAYRRARTRIDKAGVTVWLNSDAHRQLRQLALDTDQSMQTLLEEAVDRLFAHYRKPQIARRAA